MTQNKANKIFSIYSLILILVFNFYEVKSQANPKSFDSLTTQLKYSKMDTNKVNLLNQISESLLRTNPELSRKYSIDALNLSQDLVWEKGKANSLLRIGNSYYLTNDIPNANKFYKRALEFYKKNNILSGEATTIGNIGLIYAEQNLIKEADSCYRIALSIGKKINDKKIIQRNYSNLGVLYSNEEDFKNALYYYFNSIQAALEIKDDNGLAISYSNVGNIYNRKKTFDKAIGYYKKAINLNLKSQNNVALSYNYYNIAQTYSDLKNYDKSIYYHKLNLKLQETVKDTSFIIDIKLQYAALENDLKNYDNSLKLYNEIKPFILKRDIKNEKFMFYLGVAQIYNTKINESIKKDKLSPNEIKKNLNLILAKQNIEKAKKYLDTNILNANHINFDLAYSNIERLFEHYKVGLIYFQKYIGLRDSLNTIKNSELIYNFEYKLELAEKNRELKVNQLKLENTKKNQTLTYIALILVSILLLTFIVLFSKIRKLNQRLENKNQEISDSNQSKDKLFSIIAHDLINPISSFKNVTHTLTTDFLTIEKEEQLEYLSLMKVSSEGLLEMLKNLLDWSRFQRGHLNYNFEQIPIRNVTNQYLSLFELSAKEKNIKLIDNISNNPIIITENNLFQTIIRNVLSNAIKFSKIGGIIEVSTYEGIEYHDNKYTEISIKDNGVGISIENLEILNRGKNHISMFGTNNEKGTGLGLVLCKDYLTILKGEMIIESEIGKGTNIRILLPI